MFNQVASSAYRKALFSQIIASRTQQGLRAFHAGPQQASHTARSLSSTFNVIEKIDPVILRDLSLLSLSLQLAFLVSVSAGAEFAYEHGSDLLESTAEYTKNYMQNASAEKREYLFELGPESLELSPEDKAWFATVLLAGQRWLYHYAFKSEAQSNQATGELYNAESALADKAESETAVLLSREAKISYGTAFMGGLIDRLAFGPLSTIAKLQIKNPKLGVLALLNEQFKSNRPIDIGAGLYRGWFTNVASNTMFCAFEVRKFYQELLRDQCGDVPQLDLIASILAGVTCSVAYPIDVVEMRKIEFGSFHPQARFTPNSMFPGLGACRSTPALKPALLGDMKNLTVGYRLLVAREVFKLSFMFALQPQFDKMLDNSNQKSNTKNIIAAMLAANVSYLIGSPIEYKRYGEIFFELNKLKETFPTHGVKLQNELISSLWKANKPITRLSVPIEYVKTAVRTGAVPRHLAASRVGVLFGLWDLVRNQVESVVDEMEDVASSSSEARPAARRPGH